MLEPGNDDSGRPPGQHLEQHPFLLLRKVVGHAHDRLERRAFEGLGDSGHDVRKDHVREAQDDDRHQAGLAQRKGAGDPVRHVAKLLGRPQDLFPGGVRNIPAVPQGPADRHFGNVQSRGNVLQRQWSRPRACGLRRRNDAVVAHLGASLQWRAGCCLRGRKPLDQGNCTGTAPPAMQPMAEGRASGLVPDRPRALPANGKRRPAPARRLRVAGVRAPLRRPKPRRIAP